MADTGSGRRLKRWLSAVVALSCVGLQGMTSEAGANHSVDEPHMWMLQRDANVEWTGLWWRDWNTTALYGGTIPLNMDCGGLEAEYDTASWVVRDTLVTGPLLDVQVFRTIATYPSAGKHTTVRLPTKDEIAAANPGYVPFRFSHWFYIEGACHDEGVAPTWSDTLTARIDPTTDPPDPGNDPPVAGFDATSTGTPGQYQFVSTSSDPDGDALRYAWEFGDGTTSDVGPATTKTYDKPGDYSATLTVTDPGGLSDTSTKSVEVAAPELGVDIRFPGVGSPLFSEDDEFDVDVVVSAGAGLGALSSVSFEPAGLTVASGSDVVEIIQGPTPAIPASLTLAPNSSQTYRFKVRAIAAGSFELRSAVKAQDAAGRAVPTEQVERNGRVGRIDVEVALSKDDVELENNDDGPIPEDLDVTVTITNPLTTDITDVTVDVQQLVTVGTRPRDPRSIAATWLTTDGDGAVIEGRPTPEPIETLGPGERREVKLRLRAKDDGKVAVRVLVHADADGGPLSGAGSAELNINDPVMLYFEAAKSDGTPAIVQPGSRWRINGKFVNRTADRTIIVRVVPETIANTHGGVPIPTADGPPDDSCGMGIRVEIPPGEAVPWAALVQTVAEGGTRSEVHYEPVGFWIDDDGEERAMSQDAIRVKAGSSEVRVSVLESTEQDALTFEEAYWIFTDNAARHYGQTVEGLIAFVHMSHDLVMGTVDGLTSPWTWSGRMEQAYAGFADYVLQAYQNLTPEEQAAWRSGIARMYMGVAGVTFNQARQAVDASITGFFERGVNNYYNWDTRDVIAWFGSLVGDNPDALLDMALAGYGMCQLVRKTSAIGPRAILRGAAAQAETLVARISAKGIRGFLPGDIIEFGYLKQLFGVDKVSHRMLLDLAREWNIIVLIRSRGKGAIERLLKGSVFKPEKVKIKNVNPTDVKYLGFHPDDLDLVVIKDPGPWEAVESQLVGADPEEIAKVKERWQTRHEEWNGKGNGKPSDLEQMLDYQENGVPVPRTETGVNPIDNGVPADPDSVWERRPLDLQDAATTDGRPAYRVRIGVQNNPSANWVPGKKFKYATVTGDIDPIAFLRTDLSPLPPQARQKLYKVLRYLGFQHPETLTWTNAAGRLKYLTENHALGVAGAEPLAAYLPNGKVRATYFDGKKAWADPDNAEKALIWFNGAETTVDPVGVRTPLVGPRPDDAGIPFVAPGAWAIPRPDGQCDGERADDDSQCVASVQFSNDDDAPVLRQPGLGQLESWDSKDGWSAYEAPAGDTVATRPQTMLTNSVPAGATRLPIAPAAALGMDGPGNDWFEVGQTVVINPGGANQEAGVIAGFGSIILERPSRHGHSLGEMIVAIENAPITAGGDPDSGGELPRTGGDPGGLAATGLLMLLLGAALAIRRRRRFAVIAVAVAGPTSRRGRA